MIYAKDVLTKLTKKGRTTAVNLLNELSKAGGLPEPHYEYKPGGTTKKPIHFYKLRFRLPRFLVEDLNYDDGYSGSIVTGSGKANQKQYAKSLAALETVHRIEEGLNTTTKLSNLFDEYKEMQRKKQEEIEAAPVEQQLPGVAWENLPLDINFPETLPATRRGRIDFFPSLVKNKNAFMAAKAMTLSSKEGLPEVQVHANQTDDGLQRWANFNSKGSMGVISPSPARGMQIGIDNQQAEILALEQMQGRVRHHLQQSRTDHFLEQLEATGNDSFGMAKLYVNLPQHQLQQVKELLQEVEANKIPLKEENIQQYRETRSRRQIRSRGDAKNLMSRLATFRKFQKDNPLPIDSVEANIPHESLITIVRGGTGSGKTTRYPLMLSLLSPSGPSTKVLVAQPRRLACQTAARRVAFEQGFQVGSQDCPIGYAIRFESIASSGSRTVDFATPGLLLRRAMNDPMFQDVTHMVIDEVHERNADIDLLLALTKRAVKRRINHESLPPLRVVLMSATVDSTVWESYFDDEQVAIVDVPETRQFPIDMVHLDDPNFPAKHIKSIQMLRKGQVQPIEYDETLCQATAELASTLFNEIHQADGSILCFLPGMEEIRHVDSLLRKQSRGKQPIVRYLHSSLSSREQAKVFEPGPKIILSTNLAETSVTIPDVKVVIDTGRERQHSLLESSSPEASVTVVGSQLATVNISQASAKQRAGRAGRVSAGTCYRLYTRRQLETDFVPYTLPEMLRMDLSQLVLHSLSLYHSTSGSENRLQLLLDAPDPPEESRLRQALRGLASQGLVDIDPNNEQSIILTPLGRQVSQIPATPRYGRLLFVGLMLRAIEPALQIAALLSVPKIFSTGSRKNHDLSHCSDVAHVLEEYQDYRMQDAQKQERHPRGSLYRQAHRVERQLEHYMKRFIDSSARHAKADTMDWAQWNIHGDRFAAQVGLVCGATPHIAHLVTGKNGFATRDVAGTARIHPSSINFDNTRRVHWYVYNELRATKSPYLHLTTAVSPLELALFAEASSSEIGDGWGEQHHGNWLFVADQWVPVDVPKSSHRDTLLKLRRLLMHDMLQQVAQDPASILASPAHERILLFVLSALEQQRLSK
jgi:ATP-dependent RNA helicase DHX57